MDVLKEIARAESRAREIEQEFRQKAEALVSASQERLARARQAAQEEMETGLAALRAELDKSLEAEKETVRRAAIDTEARLEKQVRENASRAVEIVLKRIGL